MQKTTIRLYFKWADLFCFTQMVTGEGPHSTPDSGSVHVHAAPIRRQYRCTLKNEDSILSATLYAIDPPKQPEAINEETELLKYLQACCSPN